MSIERFNAIILLCQTIGLIAGGTIGVVKFFKYLEVRLTEKSVGATKVKQIEDAVKKVQADGEEVQKEHRRILAEAQKEINHHSKAIDNLEEDLKNLMHHISDAFFGKK